MADESDVIEAFANIGAPRAQAPKEAEVEADEIEGEEPEELEGEEPEEEAEAEDENEDEDDTDEDNDDPLVKIPGVGEVRRSELQAGVLRQSDYTRKTQELANQRREFEARSAQTQAAMLRQAQITDHLVRWAQNLLPSDDQIEAALQIDPAEGFRLQRRRDAMAADLNELFGTAGALSQEAQAEAERATAELRAQGMQYLNDHIPAWRDAQTRNAELQDMQRVAEAYGLDPSLIDATNSVAVRMLRDFTHLLRVQSGATRAVAAVRQQPPREKTNAPPTARRKNPDENLNAIARAKRTGKSEDILAAFAKLPRAK